MAHSYVASIEEELICCVCFELFVDPHVPKELNCPHVICEVCLNHLVGKDSAIECPQCRVLTKVSKKYGVAALRTNLGIRNLAEKHQRHLRKKEQQTPPPLWSNSQDDQVPVCSDHSEKMHFYCITCNTFVCHACTVVNHMRPDHQIEDVKVLRREKMKEVGALMNKLEQDARQCEKKSRKMCATEEIILSSIKNEEKKIDSAVALMVKNAYKQGDAFKAEIRRKNDPKLKQCQRKKASLQKQAHVLLSAVDDTKAVAGVASSHNFVMQHRVLMDKLNSIQVRGDVGLVQYTPGEVEFEAEPLTIRLGTITGKLRERPVREQVTLKKRNNTGLVRKIKVSAKFGEFTGGVISIASNISGDILAISDENSSLNTHAVHIYSKQLNGQYQYQSSLKVTDPQFEHERCYVAVTADGKYLVAKGRSIHVYSSSGQYQRVCYTAPTHTNTSQFRLKFIITLKDGRIIAGDYARSVITVHTPDGSALLKTINTNIQPSSITAVNSTHVAISHYGVNKVCVIDLESGRETFSIDIDEPWAVCYDEVTDCLLISRDAGAYAGVIDQYSLRTGFNVACIAQNLDWPTALIFTGDGMLAVRDRDTVKLYKASV